MHRKLSLRNILYAFDTLSIPTGVSSQIVRDEKVHLLNTVLPDFSVNLHNGDCSEYPVLSAASDTLNMTFI